MFVDKRKSLHWKYGLGIPLTKSFTVIFHKLYGTDGQTTPDDFGNYYDRYPSGDIQLPTN